MHSFIDKLKTNISDKNSNLCVGIDIDRKYFNDNCGYSCELLTAGGSDDADVYKCYPPGHANNPFEDSFSTNSG